MLSAAGPLAAQNGRALVELGAGSLSPTDPFGAALGLRASAGWVLDAQDAVTLEYSRQPANRSESAVLGLFPRHFLGIGWQHAFRNAFANPIRMKQQYLVRLSAGFLLGRVFPEAVAGDRLKPAPFLGLGLVIRYPFSQRIALIGTIDDALVFLPRQTVRSYCGAPSGFLVCYPRGGGTFYAVDVGGKAQQNFALLATLQLRL